MRLRNITLAGIILLVLALTVGMAGATDQNVTGNETTTVNNATVNETITVNETGTPTATSTATAIANTSIAGAEDDENNIEADEGLIGPGNALYGLKIAFENIGETFTFNASEKLGLQVAHARQRIAEARAELKKNNTEAADKALAQYGAKMNAVNETMSKLSDNDTGLINAQKEIAKHQVILEQLLVSHPNSTGIQRAYNNSMELQKRFELKVEQRLDSNITKGNQEVARDKESKVEQRPDSNITKGNQTIAKDRTTGVSVKNETSEKGTNSEKRS
jgi:hypothetical protein